MNKWDIRNHVKLNKPDRMSGGLRVLFKQYKHIIS